MADNYIERQQEQYEARKAAWKQAQKYGKKKQQQYVRLNRSLTLQRFQNRKTQKEEYL